MDAKLAERRSKVQSSPVTNAEMLTGKHRIERLIIALIGWTAHVVDVILCSLALLRCISIE